MFKVKNKTQRYKGYKDSGVEWLGEIPEHWEATRVKNIFRLVVEPAPNNNDFELLSVYTEIGVKPRKELKEKGNKASTTDGYWLVKKGDIIVNKLLAWMGAIGVSNYNGVTSPAYDILRAKVDIESNFYHYLFRNSACISELKKHSRGIMDMRLRLYFDKFGDVVIPYPSFDEQKIIVSFLDDKTTKIEDAIAIKEQQIQLLKERKQILIHKAVTKGLDKNVAFKDSGVVWIGNIPTHWELKRFKFIAKANKGKLPNKIVSNPYNNLPPYMSMEYLRGGIENQWVSDKDAIVINSGETLLLWDGSNSGEFIKSRKGVISSTVAHIIFKGINENFAWYYSTVLEREIRGNTIGMGIPHVNGKFLNNLSVLLPTISEQKEISAYIENASQKIETAIGLKQEEIAKLKEYKSSLINGVVTGKVKVC
ncbi:restriction endonuclease subunit S [Polaribacter haliotis]|uniref:Restriction endonuclease subunit S n=2 Tax=Polaribacter TaxID=52959 RepID=A0A7L8AGE6_9FLAO|nr:MULTISPECIES: restriction endonuclease subunit S [Polaribacter]MDD7914108.1 restriction endonuclease subunit S [Polaribacter sp. MSW5]QOD61014.1 restriction endonuclease subunit S [Polaribacter haliotis]